MHRSHYDNTLCCGGGDGVDGHDRLGRDVLVENQQIALAPADFKMLSASHVGDGVCVASRCIYEPFCGDISLGRMQDKGVILLFDAADGGIEQKLDAVCGSVFCSCDGDLEWVNDAGMRAVERLNGIG